MKPQSKNHLECQSLNDCIKTLEEYSKSIDKVDISFRYFELNVTSIVKCIIKTEGPYDKESFVNEMNRKLENAQSHDQKTIAFTFFFALFTYYRRKKELNDVSRLIEKYNDNFNDIPFMEHAKLLRFALEPYNNEKRKKLIKRAQDLAEKEQFSEHSGILHHFAELCAEYYEYNASLLSDKNEELNHKLLNSAYETAKKIVELESYSKFYSTLGRLASIKKYYNEAFRYFHHAIAIEDNQALKTTYQLYQMQTTMGKKMQDRELSNKAELRTQEKNYQNKLHELKAEQIRTLGLFAGLITFILGSINIVISDHITPIKTMSLFLSVFLISFALVNAYMLLSKADYKNKLIKALPILMIIITFSIGVMLIYILINGGGVF